MTGLDALSQSSLDAGVSFDRWKVSWTLHPSGSLTLYVRGPFTSVTGKGPYLSTSSFAEGLSVSRSFDEIHTKSSTLRGGVSLTLLAY